MAVSFPSILFFHLFQSQHALCGLIILFGASRLYAGSMQEERTKGSGLQDSHLISLSLLYRALHSLDSIHHSHHPTHLCLIRIAII